MQRPPARGVLLARMVLGVLGILISIPAIGVALSIGTGGPLDPVGFQTRDLSQSLDQVETALTRVQSSLGAAGSTLDDAQATATNAAQMTDSLGSAMSDLATASSLQVLGIQPFAGLAPRFRQIATRAAAVADSLRSTASDLGTSRSELNTLTSEVTRLATLAGRLSGRGGQGLGGPSIVLARLLLALFFAWLGATAGLSVAEAWPQLRRTSPGWP